MKLVVLIFLLLGCTMTAQNTNNTNEFTYNEFLGYVKRYHPLVKAANLKIDQAQANLLMARGGFDPKIEVDFDQKKFKDTEYYSVLNSTFKIPTWYGIEVKTGFDNNDGYYLNPQNTTPKNGLTSLGISIPLGQGLAINQRMADVRKAKFQITLSQAERNLAAIEVLYDASIAYFKWKRNFSEMKLYQNYVTNAEERYNAISRLIVQGDKPAIDSIEAGIIVRSRRLGLEDSKLKLAKAKLEFATFLWLGDNVPLELQDSIVPEENLIETIQETLRTNDLMQSNFLIDEHPRLNLLKNRIEILDIERRLRGNMLLPKINLDYAFLTEPNYYFDNIQSQDYKIGVNFSFPLFLRKERGYLRLAKFQLMESQFELDLESLQLKNRILSQQAEITSLEKQRELISGLTIDYGTMLSAEERLFSFGESSIFVINSRENSLISAQLSQLEIENRYLESQAALYRVMGNP